MTAAGGRIPAAVLAAAVTAGTYASLRRRPPGGELWWQRRNYAGQPVTLLAGPAVVAGLAAGIAAADSPALRERLRLARLMAAVGIVGGYDDLRGATTTKGFAGHLRALRGGAVTSGLVKGAVVATAGLAGAAVVRPSDSASVEVLLDGALVAGTANLVNLLDLRPGRALKVVLAATVPALLSRDGALAAPVVGAAAAALPADLRGEAMLGDCGANALGAATGCLAVATLPRGVRRAALAAVVGLNLASERVSFSAVIERHAGLRRIDSWGRPAGLGGSRRSAAPG